MSKLQSYQLTHPELLSVDDLREVLKNCCIEIPNFHNLDKNNLVEIYRRIALPLPQRTNKNKLTNDNIQDSNKISVDNINNNKLSKINKRLNESSSSVKTNQDKLKSSLNNSSSMCKKICLSSVVNCDTTHDDMLKRKEEDNIEDQTIFQNKKRQKISWP